MNITNLISIIFLIICIVLFAITCFLLCIIIVNIEISVNKILYQLKRFILSNNVFLTLFLSLFLLLSNNKFLPKLEKGNDMISVLLAVSTISFFQKKKEITIIVLKSVCIVIILRIITNNFHHEFSLDLVYDSLKPKSISYPIVILLFIKSTLMATLYIEILKIFIFLFEKLEIPLEQKMVIKEIIWPKPSNTNQNNLKNINKLKNKFKKK